MSLNRELYREVLSECYEALEDVGFTRYRVKSVDWPLHNGFHAWVGLNRAPEAQSVEINPFVGIHVVQVEKLWTSLDHKPYNRSSATYAIHMGEIAPNERTFVFTPQSDIKAEARRLALLYATVGLDYARSIASYDALLTLLEKRTDMLGGYPQCLACCLYFMGRYKEAQEFVVEFAKKEPDYFENFAEAFLAFLGEARSATTTAT